MGRLIELVGLALLVWMILEAVVGRLGVGRAARRSPTTRPPGSRGGGKTGPAAEPLVRCASCGVHVPRSRALPGLGGAADDYLCERCQPARTRSQ
ncbi:MAG TPA: hypothetical protein VOA87_12730 [Thermoanaerobaculia bacterium]|nr:hypothetical protein [Thermoanaerobaculia bacterium]